LICMIDSCFAEYVYIIANWDILVNQEK